jgi:energy-coupling factor transporter ATP-binding protein EcfA2
MTPGGGNKGTGRGGRLYVRRIAVDGLFGQFDYDLRVSPRANPDPSKLMILYGDNGSGKTTMLRMLFHMLHPAPREGHRTYLSQCVFRRFEVALGENVSVIAERAGGIETGAFGMQIRRGGRAVARVDWKLTPDGGIRGSKQGERAENELLRGLAGLGLSLHFLRDDREMRIAAPPSAPGAAARSEATMLQVARARLRRTRRHGTARAGEEALPTSLEIAVRRASSWAVDQTLSASTKGDEDANAIYAGIIRRLARPAEAPAGKRHLARRQMISELETLAQRTLEFSRYGMIAPADATAFVGSIRRAKQQVLPTIHEVMSPYLNGLRARLDALQRVRDRVDAFVTIANGFYTHKTLHFDLREGLSIVADHGGALPTRALSSGEKQLLLMLCNLLVAGDENGIFIVDEPELSLNVKWQRQLTTALLELAAGTSTQFVLATHSISLLARHRESVVMLRDTGAEPAGGPT